MIEPDPRGRTSVVGIVILVAVTVVMATTGTHFVFDIGSDAQPKAPYIETSYELVEDQENIDDE